MQSNFKLLPKQTAEIEITLSWSEVKKAYDEVVSKTAQAMEIPGFRKGKAPKNLIEEKIEKKKIYEEVIKELIPKVYEEALRKHNLQPVIPPKIELKKAKEGEDWLVQFLVALKPLVRLKNYQEKIRQLKKSPPKIWTPGKPMEKTEKEKKEEKISLEKVIEALLAETEVELSDLLIEEETNRLLADFLDEIRHLGLTLEQYLRAKGKTSQQLREEYIHQAEKTLKLEFLLLEIADQEKITVSSEEVEKLIAQVEKKEEQEKLRKESYQLAQFLRRQKTLDFLLNL